MTTNKAKNKIVKSVSFNLTNETDALILKTFKRRNFSGYVKKLLLAEILLKEQELVLEGTKAVSVKQTSSDRLAKLKEQMKKPKLTD